MHRTAESWLGHPFDGQPEAAAVEALLLRYLEAFGPASVMDAQKWSGLTRLRPHFERLRARLVTFRDEAGRELFDLPAAPRPDPDVPAPPRFLPEFDNLLLAYADRARVLPPEHAPLVMKGGIVLGTILLDGRVAGSWRVEGRRRRAPALKLELFCRPSRGGRSGLEEEGRRLLAFAAPDGGGGEMEWVGR